MQGFNKYYPPDYDGEKHGSLNSYQGKHALGDRARKINQGILIVRFEMPFNIWCGTCENHIGMGVRYNAEKRKIGNYYSTPIFAFRCKCHLCSGWFEIQTDPKNTRYVVTSGARQKDEEWDPEANGGFAIHDPDKAGPSDPLNALEKQTDAKNYMQKVQAPRIDELQDASDNVNADPYTLSQRARKRFRAVKKEDQARTVRDTELKDRYSLPSEFALVREDDSTVADANSEWSKARAAAVEAESKRRKRTLEQPTRLSASRVVSAAGGKYSTSGLSTLGRRILDNTSRRSAVTQRRGAGP